MVIKTKGKDHLIRREDCVFVVIDFQERLLPVIAHKDRILENVVRLAKFARIVGLPVIVTEQEKLGSTVPEVKTGLPDVVPISKVHFNCLFCDEFAEEIERTGRNTLILTGVEAHICVAQTALHALSRYTVHVVNDATSSRTLENRATALERMRGAGAVITSTEMVIYELLQRAGTEEFKSALHLVK